MYFEVNIFRKKLYAIIFLNSLSYQIEHSMISFHLLFVVVHSCSSASPVGPATIPSSLVLSFPTFALFCGHVLDFHQPLVQKNRSSQTAGCEQLSLNAMPQGASSPRGSDSLSRGLASLFRFSSSSFKMRFTIFTTTLTISWRVASNDATPPQHHNTTTPQHHNTTTPHKK